MADNNEKSRADELFRVLNEVNGEETAEENAVPAAGAPLNDDTVEDHDKAISDQVDELLGILSKNSEEKVTEETVDEETDASQLEGEIPEAIFGHLSDETEITDPEKEVLKGVNGIHVTSVGSHFTEEAEPAPPLPEEEEEVEEEEEEKATFLSGLAKIIKGSSFIPKAVIYVLVVLIVSAYLSYFIITIGNDVFALVTSSHEITVTIPEGADHSDVAEILEENGIIKYGWVYELYMDYRSDGDAEEEYIPGEHILNTDMNYSELIFNLTIGDNTRQTVRVTIPEGYTVEQIIDLLIEKGVGQRTDYVEAINNYPYKWDFVKQLDEMGYSEDRTYRLEGYLYPDTYEFYTDEDEVYVINKILSAFNDKFWEDFVKAGEGETSYQQKMMDKYGMTFDDVVVLSSMIQSEGGKAEDFYYISYVFHNRLSNPDTFPYLQSDATIQYTLPERLTTEELGDPYSYDTPYNTHTNKGLPPGAICNPGLESLSAALFPEAPKDEDEDEIDAFYFVSNNAGKTYFARTESGHERNKEQVKKDNEAIEAGDYEG